MNSRILVWFSCGIASACASKFAVNQYKDKNLEILYCNTLKYEHSDNLRFLNDVEKWLDHEIKILNPEDFTGFKDIYDVFDRTKYLVGPYGARCTLELKKKVRQKYSDSEDVHIFGFTADEKTRAERFEVNNPEILVDFILINKGINKKICTSMIEQANIDIPMMYKLGYKNNNCIGCVKGGMGYWNKIRIDFPDAFDKMAKQERKMNIHILKNYYLDELPIGKGRYKSEKQIECGLFCDNKLF